MAKKIKLTRKQMKQPDEFLTWSELAWDWVAENVVYAAGILAGAVAIVLLLQWGVRSLMSAPNPVEADLQKALEVMQKPIKSETDLITDGYISENARDLATVETLTAFLKKYDGKPRADIAIIYLAQAQERMKDYPGAIASYTRLAASKLAQSDEYFMNCAYMGLARANQGAKNYQEALDNYKKVLAKDSAFKSEAMIGAARCMFEIGDQEGSVKMLQTARAEFHDSWNVEPAGFLPGYWSMKKEEDQKVIEQPPAGTAPADGSTAAKNPTILWSSTSLKTPPSDSPPPTPAPEAVGTTTP